ncbi:hypothetical protein CROQUDRAFT_662234 [Cronartium quercuum f. sp. fusiforme G11]|uniref:Uncharacterized protein n=1 Tax=Cronartium quercuum f. sp. fusiforme G11 TaxID=708437 RepID=A0A9P6N9W9_9BASI|nr:hypothetical protein CROQUDRAFT_662234 [Cronartium quercuum f. sp. fusiforme G11]
MVRGSELEHDEILRMNPFQTFYGGFVNSGSPMMTVQYILLYLYIISASLQLIHTYLVCVPTHSLTHPSTEEA